MEINNIIENIFDRIFDNITMNGEEIYLEPFDKIYKKTFGCHKIHTIMAKIIMFNVSDIEKYLCDSTFHFRFLFGKLKKKIYVHIILKNIQTVIDLINNNCVVDAMCIRLSILNNNTDLVKKLCLHTKPTPELLSCSAEMGNDITYFYLKEFNLIPNISVYNSAIIGGSIKMVTDVNLYVSFSGKLLENAFKNNHIQIILFMIDEAINNKINIKPEITSYLFLNQNIDLVNKLDDLKMIKWTNPLNFYSAVLSGSIPMIKIIEHHVPNIYLMNILDTSDTLRGNKNVLTDEMIYVIKNKKYFSHTMNYAIQSESIEIIDYVLNKGFQITVSNIITAIKQGSVEIIKHLCLNYYSKLPYFVIQYFGPNSYSKNKMIIAKILIENNLLDIVQPKLNMDNYKKISTHAELISKQINMTVNASTDPDYLIKYLKIFTIVSGIKFNLVKITQVKICLELNLDIEMRQIISNKNSEYDLQLITDAIFMYGTMDQIKKYYQTKYIPNSAIILEILCYGHIAKICYLYKNKLLNGLILNQINIIGQTISDPNISRMISMMTPTIPKLEYVIHSKNILLIKKCIEKSTNEELIANVYNLLMLDEPELILFLKNTTHNIDLYIEYCKDNDLSTNYQYLKN